MPGLDPAGQRVNLSKLMLEVGRVKEGSKVESCDGEQCQTCLAGHLEGC